MTHERPPQPHARDSSNVPSYQRPSYLPALAFVGAVIAFQNLAIRSDSAPDPFLRPALSVTQAFRLPPEEASLELAPLDEAEDPDIPEDMAWDFSETDFSGTPDPAAGAHDPIAAAILGAQEGPTEGSTSPDQPAPAPAFEDPGSVVAAALAGTPPSGTPVAPQPVAEPAPPPVLTHQVEVGESLWAIARRFNVSVDVLRALNPSVGSVLPVGARLLLSDARTAAAPTTPATRADAEALTRPAEDGKGLIYTVRVGDTLSSVARRFEVPVAALVLANGIQDLNHLLPGTEVRISAARDIEHTVEVGESLWSISQLYDLTVAEIVAFNKLDSEVLKPSQRIRVPVEGLDAEHFERILERRRMAKKSWIKPLEGRTTDHFGMRMHPIFNRKIPHRGLDIAAHTGSPIRVSRGGVVTFAGWLEGYGNLIEVRHKGGFSTRYAHCSALLARKGQKVMKGDVIAKVGSSGLATAPHVHFELRRNGVPQDPLKYL